MTALEAYRSVAEESGDSMVQRYAPAVTRIAYHLASRLPPNVQVDDLIQAGMIGLLEASSRFDPGCGASFRTFAELRIRGAMLDELRRGDWVPRNVHRKAREVAQAIREVEHAKGEAALDHEVADQLGISTQDYHKLLTDLSGLKLVSVEELQDAGDTMPGTIDSAPDVLAAEAEFVERLGDAIGGLPDREQLVLSLYYDEDLNLREIGSVLGVSESRVCQIRSQALLRLRATFADNELE